VAITKDFVAQGQVQFTPAFDIAFSLSSGQLSRSNKLLFVSGHSRGNSGTSEITSVVVRTASGGGGSLVASLTQVLNIEADNILHAAFWHLLDTDVDGLSAGTTYYLRVTTSNAFDIGAGILLLDNITQGAPTATAGTNAGGTSIQDTITVPADPGIIVDNWSGNFASGTVMLADIGETRTDASWISTDINIGELQAQAAYTDSSSSGTKTFGWSGDFHNRNALGILYYPEAAAAARRPNVHIYGAFA